MNLPHPFLLMNRGQERMLRPCILHSRTVFVHLLIPTDMTPFYRTKIGIARERGPRVIETFIKSWPTLPIMWSLSMILMLVFVTD